MSSENTNPNNFLRTIIDPFNFTSTIPDLDMTSSVLKDVSITSNITVGATGAGLLLWTPNSPDGVLRLFAWDGARYNYLETITPDQPIEDAYALSRFVSGGLKVVSSTISGGNFNVSGTFNASNYQFLPDLKTLTYQTIPSYCRSLTDKLLSVRVPDGLVALAYPDGRYDFLARETNGVHTISNVIEAIVPDTSFTAQNVTFTAGVEFPDNLTGWTTFVMQFYMVSAGNPGACSALLTINQRNADPNNWANNIVVPIFCTIDGFGSNLINTVISRYFRVYIPGFIDTIQVAAQTGTFTLGMGGNNLSIQNESYYARGYLGPGTLIAFQSVTPGQEISLAGKLNYEAVPDAQLSRDIPTSRGHMENPLEMELAEYAIAHGEENGIKFLYELNEYNLLSTQGFFHKISTERNTISMSGFDDFFKKLVQIGAPLLGTMTTAYTGNPLIGGMVNQGLQSLTTRSVYRQPIKTGSTYRNRNEPTKRLRMSSCVDYPLVQGTCTRCYCQDCCGRINEEDHYTPSKKIKYYYPRHQKQEEFYEDTDLDLATEGEYANFTRLITPEEYERLYAPKEQQPPKYTSFVKMISEEEYLAKYAPQPQFPKVEVEDPLENFDITSAFEADLLQYSYVPPETLDTPTDYPSNIKMAMTYDKWFVDDIESTVLSDPIDFLIPETDPRINNTPHDFLVADWWKAGQYGTVLTYRIGTGNYNVPTTATVNVAVGLDEDEDTKLVYIIFTGIPMSGTNYKHIRYELNMGEVAGDIVFSSDSLLAQDVLCQIAYSHYLTGQPTGYIHICTRSEQGLSGSSIGLALYMSYAKLPCAAFLTGAVGMEGEVVAISGLIHKIDVTNTYKLPIITPYDSGLIGLADILSNHPCATPFAVCSGDFIVDEIIPRVIFIRDLGSLFGACAVTQRWPAIGGPGVRIPEYYYDESNPQNPVYKEKIGDTVRVGNTEYDVNDILALDYGKWIPRGQSVKMFQGMDIDKINRYVENRDIKNLKGVYHAIVTKFPNFAMSDEDEVTSSQGNAYTVGYLKSLNWDEIGEKTGNLSAVRINLNNENWEKLVNTLDAYKQSQVGKKQKKTFSFQPVAVKKKGKKQITKRYQKIEGEPRISFAKVHQPPPLSEPSVPERFEEVEEEDIDVPEEVYEQYFENPMEQEIGTRGEEAPPVLIRSVAPSEPSIESNIMAMMQQMMSQIGNLSQTVSSQGEELKAQSRRSGGGAKPTVKGRR